MKQFGLEKAQKPFLVHRNKNLHFWYKTTFPLDFFSVHTCLGCYAVLVLVWRLGMRPSCLLSSCHHKPLVLNSGMVLTDMVFLDFCTSGSSFSGTGHWGICTEPSPCCAGVISAVHCFSEPLQFIADREEGVENLLCPWTLFNCFCLLSMLEGSHLLLSEGPMFGRHG